MSDPTTEGFVATPAEIEGMVRNLCAYALGEPDPIQRYLGLTQQQVLFEGMVEAIRRERGRVLADLVVAGVEVAEVAAQASLGAAANVRKLISVAGLTERVRAAAAARKVADREAAIAKKTQAKKAQAKQAAAERVQAERAGATGEAPPPPLPPPPLPPHLAAPTGKRLLTLADRVALGLPLEGLPLDGLAVEGRPLEAAPLKRAKKAGKKKAKQSAGSQ